MNVMKHFTLRSLMQNKRRTVVTIIGVILSAAMITAVATMMASFISLIQRDTIAEGGNWHAGIMGVEAANTDKVTGSAMVGDCTWGRDVGFTPLEGGEETYEPYLFLRQYTPEGYAQMSIRVTEGRLPENSHEVVISERMQKGGVNIRIGDKLTLQNGRRMDLSGIPLKGNPGLSYEIGDDGARALIETFSPGESSAEYTVVGVIARPGYERSWSAGYAVLGYLDMAALAPNDKVDAYFMVTPIKRDIFDKVEKLATEAGRTKDNVVYNTELLRYYGVIESDNLNSFFYTMGLSMILIIVAASISLIYNAFAISVAERAKQLGLLSSVGATRAQKRASVYFEGLVIAAIGIPLGILAGIGGIGVTLFALRPIMSSFINTRAGVDLTLIVPLWAVAAAAFFALVTILISAWLPARRASRIMPMDAIRLSREVKLTRRAVKTSRLTRKLYGFEAEVALKNLKRNRKKYRATIVSLVLSLALFLTVSQYAHLMKSTSMAMSDGYNFDICVIYPRITSAERSAVNESVASLPSLGVVTVSASLIGKVPLTESQLSDQTKQIIQPGENGDYAFGMNLVSLDEKSFAEYAAKVGVNPADYSDPAHPKAILINYAQQYVSVEGSGTKKAAGDILTVHPGDVLTYTPANALHPKEMDITLGALTDERPMGILIQNYTETCMVVTKPVMDAAAAECKENVQHSLYMNVTAEGDDQTLEKEMTDLMQNRSIQGYSLFNIHSAARALERNINLFMGVLVYGFITLITLICIANIFNTVSTNIALRRKEFAMLRSVGMTPGGFNKMIRYESIFYGLKGLLYGLPLSLLIAYLLYKVNRSMVESAFSVPWISYGIGILMILVIVFATMLYATGKIKRENIIDALKEENM